MKRIYDRRWRRRKLAIYTFSTSTTREDAKFLFKDDGDLRRPFLRTRLTVQPYTRRVGIVWGFRCCHEDIGVRWKSVFLLGVWCEIVFASARFGSIRASFKSRRLARNPKLFFPYLRKHITTSGNVDSVWIRKWILKRSLTFTGIVEIPSVVPDHDDCRPIVCWPSSYQVYTCSSLRECWPELPFLTCVRDHFNPRRRRSCCCYVFIFSWWLFKFIVQ